MTVSYTKVGRFWRRKSGSDDATWQQRRPFPRRSFFAGLLFGGAFIVVGTLLESFLRYQTLTLATALQVQKQMPLLWVLDSAPLVLGVTASLVRLSVHGTFLVSRRGGALTVLLSTLTLLPLALLTVELNQTVNEARLITDAERVGSLRYRTLLIHAAANKPAVRIGNASAEGSDWRKSFLEMQTLRETLRRTYPREIGGTDTAWTPFAVRLQRTGTVDWKTTQRLWSANNTMTRLLVTESSEERGRSAVILSLGTLAVLLSALLSLALLRKLRHTETDLHGEQAFIHAIMDTAGALVVVLDTKGHIVRFNRACEQLTGYRADEVMGKVVWDVLVVQEDMARSRAVFAQLSAGNFPNQSEGFLLARDGTRKRLAWSNTALTDSKGAVTHIVGTGIDITERHESAQRLAEANAQLHNLATHDGLTGVGNRRAFDTRLETAWNEARRYNRPLSLLLLDVDHFKSFNDKFGHPAGDAALTAVAQLLRQEARQTDFVARYGGEEFVLLLPHTDTNSALHLAERLRRAIENAPLSSHRAITASLGAATLHSEMKEPRDLLAAADWALYQAKIHRNRAVHNDWAIAEIMEE